MTGPTSPTSERRDRRGGFTLVELMMALVVVALLAALALPRVWPAGGATTGRATAYAVAAVLRSDRDAAIARGASVATSVDVAGRRVSSGGGDGSVTIPGDVEVSTRGVEQGRIDFHPDGRSSGGLVTLTRDLAAYTVRVDAVTGGVMILSGEP